MHGRERGLCLWGRGHQRLVHKEEVSVNLRSTAAAADLVEDVRCVSGHHEQMRWAVCKERGRGGDEEGEDAAGPTPGAFSGATAGADEVGKYACGLGGISLWSEEAE